MRVIYLYFQIDTSLAEASDKHVSLEAALFALKSASGPTSVAILAARVKEAAERLGPFQPVFPILCDC